MNWDQKGVMNIMRLCNKGCCTPCCDFCIHVIHGTCDITDKYGNIKKINGGPIGCNLHKEEKYQIEAKTCGWCEDFDCFQNYKKIKI